MEGRKLGLALSVAALAVMGWIGLASSQPGTVLTQHQISRTQGGFTGIIDDADEFGGAITSLGDLDGPGPSTLALAVGVIGDDDGGTDRGAAYILFLNDAGTVLSHRKISDTVNFPGTPLDSGDQFGGSVAFLGDLDGAGPSAAALAVGAALDDDGGTDRGAVYVLFLSAAGDVLTFQKISELNLPGTPLDSSDEFGGAMAFLGDLDGAGPSAGALAVGAIGDEDGGTDRGALYVLFLSASGSVSSLQKISETQGNFTGSPLDAVDDFGGALAHLGDLDGAGPSVATLAVGASGDDDGGTDRGAVYVLFLNAAGSVLSYQKISDTQGGFLAPLVSADEFGGAIALLGDLDEAGPAVTAIAVGAIGDDTGGPSRGAAYVLFLNASGSVLAYRKIGHGLGGFGGVLDDGDEFGSSFAVLGDLDGAGPAAQTMATGASFDDDGGLDRGAIHALYLKSIPRLAIGDVAVAEGASGTTSLGFLVSLSHTTDQMVTVAYETADGDATSGDDYTPASGTLTFPAGSIEPQAIAVDVHGDAVPEPDEGLLVSLTNAQQAVIADGQAQGTILNDDGASAVDPSSASVVALGPVTPNPSGGEASVQFFLPLRTHLRLSVFDVRGRELVVLAEGPHPPGLHEATWNGMAPDGKAAPGVYFLRLQTAQTTVARRLVLVE